MLYIGKLKYKNDSEWIFISLFLQIESIHFQLFQIDISTSDGRFGRHVMYQHDYNSF